MFDDLVQKKLKNEENMCSVFILNHLIGQANPSLNLILCHKF